MRILALESSCDESAAAVLDSERGLLAHELFSQIELHRIYGGVVPELASRDHVRKLLPLVRSALAAAGTDPSGPGWRRLYRGPGLIGALADRAPPWRAALRTPGACPPSPSIIWRGICWRRCSRTTRRRFPMSHF